jgi:hypothetical protein
MRHSQSRSGTLMAGLLATVLGTLFVLLVIMAALAFGA